MRQRQKGPQRPLLPRLPQPITRRFRMCQNLLQRVPAQAVLPTRRTTTQLVRQNFPTNFLPKFHVASHSRVSW
jgi:hypothetical protein